MKDLSHWNVPDDYATRFMAHEAEFCAREALESRNRGCDEYVIDHYKRRAELLNVAIATLSALCSIPCDWKDRPHLAQDHEPLDDRESEPTAAEEYEDRRDHERAHSASRLG